MTINFILWLSCGLMGNMGKGNSPDDIIEWTFYYRFSKNPKHRNIEYDTWFHIPRTWINFPAARCLKNRVLGKPELVLRHGDLHQSEMCIHIYENVCFWGRRSNNLALSCWRPLKVAQLWGDNIGRVRRNILRRSDPLNYRIHDAGNLLHAPLAAKCPTVRQQIRLNLSKYCRSDGNRESERKKKQQHWNALLAAHWAIAPSIRGHVTINLFRGPTSRFPFPIFSFSTDFKAFEQRSIAKVASRVCEHLLHGLCN